MLARPRRQLVADALADPDRALVAVVCGWLGADVLWHHARVVCLDPAVFGRLRSALGRAAQALVERPSRAGQRHRSADDATRDLFSLGAAQVDQTAHQHAVKGCNMPAVLVEDVSRHFGDVVAVDRVNLSIARGEFVTLLGPSGCGKTTTLRMVAGLEQNTGGRISIADRVVSDAAAGFFVPPDHRQLGMVFQSYAIWPHMTVFDNVAYPLRIRRRSKAEIHQRVHAVLRLVEMETFADRPAPALSGGQQQRVAIARALVFEPEVLLLDEPLSNLDARLRAQMGEEFRALQRRLGITALYVTHDQEEAMALSDRIVVMQRGRILQTGEPETVYRRPASREVASFFGTPNLIEASVTGCRRHDSDYLLTIDGAQARGACRAAQP